MGESARRKKLGLPPQTEKQKKVAKRTVVIEPSSSLMMMAAGLLMGHRNSWERKPPYRSMEVIKSEEMEAE